MHASKFIAIRGSGHLHACATSKQASGAFSFLGGNTSRPPFSVVHLTRRCPQTQQDPRKKSDSRSSFLAMTGLWCDDFVVQTSSASGGSRVDATRALTNDDGILVGWILSEYKPYNHHNKVRLRHRIAQNGCTRRTFNNRSMTQLENEQIEF